MQTFLMRQGIEERDYARRSRSGASSLPLCRRAPRRRSRRRSTSCWAAQQRAAQQCRRRAKSKKESQARRDEQLQAKKRVADLIGRSRKAFGFLYAALPADLRQLVADVPQGYAFGIWSFLEKKFRNTEQDSVMALWERFTTCRQERGDVRRVQGASGLRGRAAHHAKQTLAARAVRLTAAVAPAASLRHSSADAQDGRR